jgi:PKD repeat protein
MRSAYWLLIRLVVILSVNSPLEAAVLSLGTPIAGACGEVSINGVVLPSAGDTIVKIDWEWGDGKSNPSFFPATHSYLTNGTYIVRVTATSQAGEIISRTVDVTVTSAENTLCAYEVRLTPGWMALRGGVTSASVRVTVLSPSGEIIPVDVSNVDFTSSNGSLVQVDATGKVTATGFGEATLEAKPRAYPRSAKMTVVAGHVRVEPPILVLSMAGTNSGQLTVDAANADGTPLDLTKERVEWAGGNGSASVSATGLVTALQPPTPAVGQPAISASVRGIASRNSAKIRVLPGSQAVSMRRVAAPAGANTVFYLADSVGGFSPTQVFADHDAARIVELAYGFQREASGVAPNKGDLQYLTGDVALTADPTRPCGYSGNPVVLGSALDTLNSCVIEVAYNAPAWGIFFHELGHNFTLSSRRFSDFAVTSSMEDSGTTPNNVKVLYLEGLATAIGMYAGRSLRDSAARYVIPQSTVNSILNSHLVWWHPGSTPSLDAYIRAGAAYDTMTADVLDDMLMVLMEDNGYQFFRRFFAVFLPADMPFPFTLKTEVRRATFFVAAMSAATRTDLRNRFRGNWGFPIDDAFYAEIYPKVMQYAAYADALGWASVGAMVPVGGANTSSTWGSPSPLQAGYAAASVYRGSVPYGTAVFSFKQNGFVVSEAGVPASPPTTAARIFIDYRSSVAAIPGRISAGTVNINTGIAMVNYGSATANVTYSLRNINGEPIASGHGILAAGAHFAKFIDQLKEAAPDFVLPANFQSATQFASLEISSDQPLSVLALRMTINQRGEVLFTTTPIADLTKPAASSAIFFPQFADGGGYTTSLVLLNTSNEVETGTIQILKDNGDPLLVNEVGGTARSVFSYTIHKNGVFRLQTDGSSSTTMVGWVKLTPDAGTSTPVGAGVFGYNPGNFLVTESGIPATVSTTHARIYVDMSGGHGTGLAIANSTNTNATITITAYQNDGVTGVGTSRDPLQILANGHSARFADQFVDGLPAGFTGVLDISASTPFAALTMRSLYNGRRDFLLATFPIADMTQSAPSPVVFPQIADGDGYVTQFILIGAGGASSVTLNFYGDYGKPLPVGK